MATHQQKLACEERVRALLSAGGLPQPDSIEFGNTCIWVFFNEPKTCLRIDIDEDPEYDYATGEYSELTIPPAPLPPGPGEGPSAYPARSAAARPRRANADSTSAAPTRPANAISTLTGDPASRPRPASSTGVTGL